MQPWPTDDRYSVTKDGRVFRTVAIGAVKAKEMTRHLGKRGYYTVQIGRNWYYVHRMVAETYIRNDDPENKTYVAHNDGTRTVNTVENLRWATPKQNSSDKVRHGTLQFGASHPSSVLTEDNVRAIQALTFGKPARRPPYHRELAEQFGVTRECITRIANKDRWRRATL